MPLDLLLPALGGVIIRFGGRIGFSAAKKKPINWLLELTGFVLSVVVSLIVIFCRDEFKNAFVITPFTSAGVGFGALHYLNKYIAKGAANSTSKSTDPLASALENEFADPLTNPEEKDTSKSTESPAAGT